MVTDGGRTLSARAVILATHLRTTLRLLEPGALPTRASARLHAVGAGNGCGVTMHLITDALPRYGALAVECARLFQSCSASVEGRNGYLSLRHHHLHALPTPWLKMMTILHNYVIRRDDGTTAAERFFGAAHGDLLEHLVEVMPMPARPRRRQSREPPDLFAAAA